MVLTAAVKQRFVDLLGLENHVTCFWFLHTWKYLGVALYISFQPLWLTIGGNALMLPYCLLRQLNPSLAPESIPISVLLAYTCFFRSNTESQLGCHHPRASCSVSECVDVRAVHASRDCRQGFLPPFVPR